jgi:nudix-type nucleoside diphosphatase (YffH/AdpP family)
VTRPDLSLLDRRRLFSGWNSVDEITVAVRHADGTSVELKREVIDHGHAVAVLPVDTARRMALMVRQWRAPLIGTHEDPFLLEVCAGLIDDGETPDQAMHREAEEELGFRIDNLQATGRAIMSPGCLTETIGLYLATYSQTGKVSDGGGLDHEGEDIEVVEMPLDELFEIAGSGALLDAKTLILVQALMLREATERTAP